MASKANRADVDVVPAVLLEEKGGNPPFVAVGDAKTSVVLSTGMPKRGPQRGARGRGGRDTRAPTAATVEVGGSAGTLMVPTVDVEEQKGVILGISFTESQLEQCNQLHPGFKFRSQTGKSYHGHPVLRAERHIAAALAWELARKGNGQVQAVNIGGGNRLETGKFAHTIAPILSPADALTTKSGPTVCRHRLQDCDCIKGPCVAVMAHVIYYISPRELLEQMLRLDIRRLVASCHRFPNYSGKLYDEAYYTHVGPDTVQMSVRGGDTFTHSDMSWLTNSGSFIGTRLGGFAGSVSLCWNLKRTIGTTDVFEFVVVDGSIEGPRFDPHTFDNDGIATVGTVQVNASLRLRVGNSAIWTDDADPTPVPKGLISHLAVKVAGKARDQNALRDLTRDARGWIRDQKPQNKGFPEDKLPAAVSAAVRMAMLINLEEERRNMMLLHSMAPALNQFNDLVTKPFDESMAGSWSWFGVTNVCTSLTRWCSRRRVQTFVPHKTAGALDVDSTTTTRPELKGTFTTPFMQNLRLSRRAAVMGLLLLLVALFIDTARADLVDHIPLVASRVPRVYVKVGSNDYSLTDAWCVLYGSHVLNVVLLSSVLFAARIGWVSGRWIAFGTLFTNFGTATAHTGNVVWDASELAFAFVAAFVLLVMVRRNATAHRYVVFRTESVLKPGPTTATFEPDPYADAEQEPRPFVVAHAPLLGQFYPTANSNSVGNERVAIHNRAAPATVGKFFDNKQWDNFSAWVRRRFPVIFRAKKLNPVGFEKWVSRYTPAQQVKLRAAHDELASGVSDKKILHINYFLKGELSFGKLDEEGRNKSKPRVISSGSSYYNVLIGPTITAIQGWVGKPANRHKDVLMCESGRTAIGAFMEQYRDAPFVGENDYEAFDATQHVACRLLIIEMLVTHFGMRPEVARLMRAAAEEKFGHTTNGTFVSMEGTMASGHPDTYLTNTMMNILLQWYASECCGVLMPPIAAAGDDSVIFLPKEIDRVLFNSTIARLGLSCNLVVYPNEPEVHQIGYCSSIVMPRADGWFLAPAPGRMFAKLPFVRAHVPNPLAALRGNLLASWPSASRLPFVAEYYQWVLRNTEHISPDMPFEPHSLKETVAVCGVWETPKHDPATLALFRSRYGLNDLDLAAFSGRLNSHRYGESWVDHAVQTIADVDLAISEDIRTAARERDHAPELQGAVRESAVPCQRRSEVILVKKSTPWRLYAFVFLCLALLFMASAAASNASRPASASASNRRPKVTVPRKELARAVRAADHRAPARIQRARVRLDSSTEAANAYAAGLLDPFGKGRGVRRPDDGILPTAVIGTTARFEANLATNSTAGNKQAMWGYQFFPDAHYVNRRLTTFVAGGSGALSWGSLVASSAWSTIATQGCAFRGACNLGIRVRFSSAAVARGGKFIVAVVPPGGADGSGSPPTTLDQIYTAPLTAIMDIQEYSSREPGVICWLPAGGDAPFLVGSSIVWRTGSSWASTANTDQVLGDSTIVIMGYTNIGYDGTAPVVGAVDLQATIEYTLNTEFIPVFGGQQNVFPMKTIAGSEADVNKAMKPLEARFDGNALQSMADGTFSTLANAADQVGGSMLKGPGGQAAGLAMHGAASWMRMGSELLRGNYKQAGMQAAEAALSIMPMFMAKQHMIASALDVPYVGPARWYGSGHRPSSKRFHLPPKPMSDEDFLALVLTAVMERQKLPPHPLYFDGPPIGSRFGGLTDIEEVPDSASCAGRPQPEQKDAAGWYAISRARA